MILPSYGALITANVAVNVAASAASLAAVALDPTVTVAIIAAVALLGNGALGYLTYRRTEQSSVTIKEIKVDVNSNFTALRTENTALTVKVDQQNTKLADLEKRLAHSEGRREGVETKEAPKP